MNFLNNNIENVKELLFFLLICCDIKFKIKKKEAFVMNFEGKVAISTGAASGMGLLFAQNWADLGGNIALCDVNEAVLNEKVSE